MTGPPPVNSERVHAAARKVGDRLEAERRARIDARNTAHVAAGGHICNSLTRTGAVCTHPAVGRFLPGPRCADHTPAAVNGRPETTPEPTLTMEGIRRRWYAERDLPYVPFSTPSSETAIDRAAVASGKRRSTPTAYRAAQAASWKDPR